MTDFGISGKPLEYDNDVVIDNSASNFWPDINLGEFQKARKIPAQIDDDMAVSALLSAINDINRRLGGFALEWRGKGYLTAGAVPGAKNGTETELTAQYKKAVYALAKSDLIGEVSSVARLGKAASQNGGTSAEDMQQSTREILVAESTMTVRQMLGLGRVGVSII